MPALSQERMYIGYNKQGNEIVANTATNQTTVVKSNVQTNSSSSPEKYTLDWWNKQYTGSLTADELTEKYAKGDELSDPEFQYMLANSSSGKRSDGLL
jgi:hypothetical protein